MGYLGTVDFYIREDETFFFEAVKEAMFVF